MNPEKTSLFQGSYFGKIMNNMKLSSRSQFPWNTIFGPVDDPLAGIESRNTALCPSMELGWWGSAQKWYEKFRVPLPGLVDKVQ